MSTSSTSRTPALRRSTATTCTGTGRSGYRDPGARGPLQLLMPAFSRGTHRPRRLTAPRRPCEQRAVALFASLPDRVSVVDVSPRDGLQNEGGAVPTADKLRLVDALVRAGVRSI